MTPQDALAQGELNEAISLQAAIVSRQPTDAAARLLLVELYAFAGRLRESRDQLRAIVSSDPGWPRWRAFFRQLLRAEWRRSVSGRRPAIMREPVPAHAVWRRRAIRALRQGDSERAVRCSDRAESASPELRGFVNGREFLGLRDADDRFASVLEAFADGAYLWFPWESLSRIELLPAAHPRDGWVREARLRLRDGTNVNVHVPLIYPDSAQGEGAFALGQETDYHSPDGGLVQCLGAKLLLCGEEEVPLQEVRLLELR